MPKKTARSKAKSKKTSTKTAKKRTKPKASAGSARKSVKKTSASTAIWDPAFLSEQQRLFTERNPRAEALIAIYLGLVIIFFIVMYFNYFQYIPTSELI